MNYWKLGCRWGSKKVGQPLFYEMLVNHKLIIGVVGKDYQENSLVLLTDGHRALGIAKVLGSKKCILEYPSLKEEFKNLKIEYSKNIYAYKAQIVDVMEHQSFNFQTQVGICRINKEHIQKITLDIFEKNQDYKMQPTQIDHIARLLKFKKQIILQGPPGTGKTKLAEEIAEQIIGEGLENESLIRLDDTLIKAILVVGQQIISVGNEAEYVVERIEEKSVILSGEEIKDKDISFDKIIHYFDENDWKIKPKNGNERGALAIARFILDNVRANVLLARETEQFKFIQFHPAYTYEDFVRGIVSLPNEDGEGTIFKAENKLLASFANAALENYLGSRGQSKHDLTFQNKLTSLIEDFRSKLDKGDVCQFGDKSSANIMAIMEDGFLYSFPNRADIKYKVLYSDMEKIYEVRAKITKPIDLRDMESEIGLKMKGKYPYYYMLLTLLKELKDSVGIPKKRNELKNFVLVIDEINRANLSSVLGELIFALEYRGKDVESMYEVNGSNRLTLPPNLYIIGTMNTADRSIGHIDYAIRRRFAFVDVLPQPLKSNQRFNFSSSLFETVAKLFVANYDDYILNVATPLSPSKYLSSEFEPKDVWLGHSYFIQKKLRMGDGKEVLEPEDINMRVKYEIVPILREYVKDGVLNPSVVEAINELEKNAL